MQVPLLAGNAFLVLRQLLCIAANLTTNEILSRKKYSYLRGSDGGFWNSFDRGCLANCLQFWCHSRPDWAAVYQEEQQVQIAVCHGPVGTACDFRGLLPCFSPQRTRGCT